MSGKRGEDERSSVHSYRAGLTAVKCKASQHKLSTPLQRGRWLRQISLQALRLMHMEELRCGVRILIWGAAQP